MKLNLIVLAVSLLINPSVFPQNEFMHCRNNKFYSGTTEFSFLGFSAYYLQYISADTSKNYLLDNTFRLAKETGIKVIRTWAFNSGSDSTTQSIIRYAPYKIKETGMNSLDYVLYKAKQYGVHLILTLENNFSDYGGVDQYIFWANKLLKPETGRNYSRTDFFTDDSIKSWYKYYVQLILNRTNTYTGIKYKDEPIIFSFELINEASDQGSSINFIKVWYTEAADFFKSIDKNHLLTTGETGYDIHKKYYSDPDFFYNSSYFLFNGIKGTSFVENTSIENVDYSSFHLYPNSWGFESLAGNTWINDHTSISSNYNKPALLGEFGVINEKVKSYKTYFETIRNTPSKSTILWDYMPPELMYMADDYAFNEIQNPDLFELFKNHIQLLKKDTVILNDKDFILYQNYPNPFNPSTTIQYMLKKPEYVKVELYNSLGELIKTIYKGIKEAGTYKLFLSFDNSLLSSGVYFYRLHAGDFLETKKMVLLK